MIMLLGHKMAIKSKNRPCRDTAATIATATVVQPCRPTVASLKSSTRNTPTAAAAPSKMFWILIDCRAGFNSITFMFLLL